jgi:hypothetical protein
MILPGQVSPKRAIIASPTFCCSTTISINYATSDTIKLKQKMPFRPYLSARLGIKSRDIKMPKAMEIPKYH